MRRIANWLRSVPHLFGKVMVVWCVACGSACCGYALRILSHTGQDPATEEPFATYTEQAQLTIPKGAALTQKEAESSPPAAA